MYAAFEQEYNQLWNQFVERYNLTQEKCIDYLYDTYIKDYRQRFIKCYINKVLHFDITMTSRDEKKHVLRHNMQETSIYLSRKIISSHFVFCRCASHNDKFVTRLSSATRIVWFTELDDNNTASTSLWNSFSYIRRGSSKKIWAESETIDWDVWRLRLAGV